MATKTSQETTQPEMEEYTEQDLESSYLSELAANMGEASYFEKAQDFQKIIKMIRIKYLGLQSKIKKLDNGEEIIIYQRDPSKHMGVNKEGVEANVRFMEMRLGKHIVLTNWGKDDGGREAMYKVLLDDMLSWFDMMTFNYEKFELSAPMFIELRITINDLLETSYRRALDDNERDKMRPVAKEIRRLLGMDKDEERELMGQGSQSQLDKLKKEADFG